MDIKCPRCGEPWEYLGLCFKKELEDECDITFDETKAMMAGRGCPSCIGFASEDLPSGVEGRIAAYEAVSDLLGDDTDGLASTLEDFDGMIWGEK